MPENTKGDYTRKIMITVMALLVLAASAFGVLDREGEAYVNNGLARALLAFGVSRGINGVVSVAQGTELSFQPVGIGLNLTPGQILDPVNDLIERFSAVMLFSASSLGIQKLVLEVVSSIIFMVISGIILVLLVVNEWSRKKFLPPWFNRALIIFLVIRLSVPVMSIASEGFYKVFLKDNYENSMQELKNASQNIEELNKENSPETENDSSILGQAKQIFKSTANSVNLSKKFENYKLAASRISSQVVDMIVVFVVQTVLFPLIFLWVVIQFSKKLISK